MLSTLHPLVISATRGRLFSHLLTRLERGVPQRPDVLRILMYHRVDEAGNSPQFDPATLGPPPAVFEEQMRFLAEHYQVVALEEVVRACQGGATLPAGAVWITFDDAQSSFAEHAWPILRRYGLPATVFVPTAYPDHPERTFWWDRLHQACTLTRLRGWLETSLGRFSLRSAAQRQGTFRKLKQLVRRLPEEEGLAFVDRLCAALEVSPTANSVLSWKALRCLARQGVALAAHTQTHPLLNRVDVRRAYAEIHGALADLRREVGEPLPVFAYPGGAWTDEVVQVLRQLGVVLAVTTSRGLNDLAVADRLRLKRINVGRSTNLNILRAQLLSWRRTGNRSRTPDVSPAEPRGLYEPCPQEVVSEPPSEPKQRGIRIVVK